MCACEMVEKVSINNAILTMISGTGTAPRTLYERR